jgi:hypothetical protein
MGYGFRAEEDGMKLTSRQIGFLRWELMQVFGRVEIRLVDLSA